jgi:hypothetical protein
MTCHFAIQFEVSLRLKTAFVSPPLLGCISHQISYFIPIQYIMGLKKTKLVVKLKTTINAQ